MSLSSLAKKSLVGFPNLECLFSLSHAMSKMLGRVSKFGVFVFTFTRNEQDDFDEMLKGVQENC